MQSMAVVLLRIQCRNQQLEFHSDRLLAAKPSLGLMHRYQTRLNLNYQRTLYNILLLRAATVPNEPSPISEHPATVNVPVTKENQP
jgi:hypothetical protein